VKQDKIEEGIWFSVAMIPKEEAWLDENYVNSWDDSDIVMRTYLKGKHMLRNLKSVVEHRIGMTHYEKPDHMANFMKNRDYFIQKYKGHEQTRIYEILVGGRVI